MQVKRSDFQVMLAEGVKDRLIDVVYRTNRILYEETINFEVLDRDTIAGQINDHQIYLCDSFWSNVNPRYVTIDLRYLDDERLLELFRFRLRHFKAVNIMDQRQLAIAAQVGQAMISRYLNGQSVPSILALEKLARALRCSVFDLWVDYNRIF